MSRYTSIRGYISVISVMDIYVRSSLPFPPTIAVHREALVGAAHTDPSHRMDERWILDPKLWLETVGHIWTWARVQMESSSRRRRILSLTLVVRHRIGESHKELFERHGPAVTPVVFESCRLDRVARTQSNPDTL